MQAEDAGLSGGNFGSKKVFPIGAIAAGAGTAINAATGLVNLLGAKKRREEQFAREDNAVQRRAADLEKAGLSKTLAAGSAAQASDPIRPSASNVNTSGVADAIKSAAETKHTRAQTALVAQQSRFIDQQIEYSKTAQDYQKWAMGPKGVAEISNLEANTGRTKAETENARQGLLNLKATLEGLDISNDEKRALFEQLKKDLGIFADFEAPYTKELPFKNIPQTVASLAAALGQIFKEAAPATFTWLNGQKNRIATFLNGAETFPEANKAIETFLKSIPAGMSSSREAIRELLKDQWEKLK